MRRILLLGLLVALTGCGEQQPEKKKEADKPGKKTSQVTPPETKTEPQTAAKPAVTPQVKSEVAANDKAASEKAATEKVASEKAASEKAIAAAPVKQEDAEQEKEQAAQEPEEEKASNVAGIMKSFADDRKAFMTKYRAAKPADRQALVDNELPKPQSYAEAMLPLVNADPASDETRTALMWMLSQSEGEPKETAAKLLVAHHMDSEDLAGGLFGLTRQPPTAAVQTMLDDIIANASEEQRRLKGIASFAKVMQFYNGQRTYDFLKGKVDSAEKDGSDEATLAKAQADLDDFMNQLSLAGQAFYRTGKMADGLELPDQLEAVSDKFGDVVLMERGPQKMLIGDEAKGTIFEMRYLAIGKTAPDISGEDLDGEEFKLSDYRGKVVVLDFWGDW
ncbi:MAG: redoxin domain-containing protein [Pirellulaceae bacterium]|nr:redoxin domain-containing protein [Pirellulaceae bacterium]